MQYDRKKAGWMREEKEMEENKKGQQNQILVQIKDVQGKREGLKAEKKEEMGGNKRRGMYLEGTQGKVMEGKRVGMGLVHN